MNVVKWTRSKAEAYEPVVPYTNNVLDFSEWKGKVEEKATKFAAEMDEILMQRTASGTFHKHDSEEI